MPHELPPTESEDPSKDGAPEGPEQADHRERLDRRPPEIWVGSLSDYNNGDLYGRWMDAARSAEQIRADIEAMLARGPAARRGEAPEEWGIFDYDGFGSMRIGEYESIDEVSRIARAIAEHGPPFAAYADLYGLPLSEMTVEGFESSYVGRFDSVLAYAEHLTGELGYEALLDALPPHVRPYVRVDYKQFAHDLQVGGDISYTDSDDGGVHVFRNE